MENFVFFFKPESKNGYLSNWSNHSITENKKTFKTMEHYIMYHKALVMSDSETAQLILDCKTPAMAKKLGRSVKNYSEEKWKKARNKVVLNGLRLKVEQNGLQKLLKDTEDKIIAEASPYDKLWGIGLSVNDDNILDQSKWGKNLLGLYWTIIRKELKDL